MGRVILYLTHEPWPKGVLVVVFLRLPVNITITFLQGNLKMALTSPGVEVTVIDESQYIPSAVNTVPYFLIATAQNKV